MKAQFALGAEVDIVSKDEFDEGVGEVLDFMKRDKSVRPIYLVQSMGMAVSNPHSGLIEVGSPPTGRLWNVLGFSIAGETDAVTSSAGSVSLFIGDRPTTGVPTMSQFRQGGMTVPATQTYSKMSQWCPSAQSVFFKLNALAGLTSFVANVWVAEYREDEISDRSGR